MNTLQIIVAVFTAVGAFAVIRQLVQRILESERLRDNYFERIHPWFIDRAYRKGEEAKVDEEHFSLKLAQLSHRSIEIRKLALDYFDNVPADPRLAKKLMEILPRQGRLDIQQRMAALLSKTLTELSKKENRRSPQSQAGGKEIIGGTSAEWSLAVSVWLSGALLCALLWTGTIPLPIETTFLASLLLFIVMVGAVRIVVRDWRWVGKIALLASVFLFAGLWAFSASTHAGISSAGIDNLESYGLADVGIHITYPNWVTGDDIDAGNKAVTVLVVGRNDKLTGTVTTSFNYDLNILKITDKDGLAIPPRFEVSIANPVGEPKEFYIHPVDKGVLRTTPGTTLTVEIETASIARQAVPELTFSTRLEHPFWKTVRDAFGYLMTASSLGAIFWFGWDRLSGRHR